MRLFTLFALLAGCGAAPVRTEDLLDGVRGYNEGVRWRRYEHAARHLPPLERDTFLDERDDLDDDLRIDDYEIVRVHADDKDHRARVQIAYTWHLDSRGLVHRTTTRQAWQRHGKRWLLAEEVRVRGEPMPGVAEPPEPGEEGEGASGAQAPTRQSFGP